VKGSRNSPDSCSRFVPVKHSYLESEARHLLGEGIGHKLTTLRKEGKYSLNTETDIG
jgi:hypothetical protein